MSVVYTGGAGRLGRSAEPQRADKRRKPGKYRNPEYSGGDHYGPAYNKPYGAAGAASSASSAASASSGTSGQGGVAHSNSHALSNSASVGAGPYGASISHSQSSANSGALAIGGYRGKPRPPYHPPESVFYTLNFFYSCRL